MKATRTEDGLGGARLYAVFSPVFALLFCAALALAVFANRDSFLHYRAGALAACALAGPLVFLLLYRLQWRVPAPGRKALAAGLAAGLAMVVVAQLFVGYSLRVAPTGDWDFGLVYRYAEQYALEGALPDEYFLWFPNNSGLYLFWCGFFSLLRALGLRSFFWPSLLLNMVCIDGAVLLLCLCARRLWGRRAAAFALLCAGCTLPFWLYLPIFYTDTLTLPFSIGAVCLWLEARDRLAAGKFLSGGLRFLALSALLAMGALFKVSVFIVWVAVALDCLLMLRGRARLPVLLAGLLAAALLYAGGTWMIRHADALPAYDYDQGIPYTHWVMMGLQGDGGYYNPDYQLTLSAGTKAERIALNLAEIQSRLAAMGPGGLLNHLAGKLSYIYGDGTYYAPLKLMRGAAAPGPLHELVLFTGRWFGFFAYGAFALQAALLAGQAAGAVQSLRHRNWQTTFLRVALFGLTLFLLLWEARSRYLVNFLPLFLLSALGAFSWRQPACK